MALVLTLRSGHDFYVEGKRVVVSWIDSPYRFGVKLPNGTGMTLTDTKWTKVFDGVSMQAGTPRNQDSHSIVRVVIDAPGIEILRGEIYRKNHFRSESTSSCETCKGTGELSDKTGCPACMGHGCVLCENKGFVVRKFKCPECSEGVNDAIE